MVRKVSLFCDISNNINGGNKMSLSAKMQLSQNHYMTDLTDKLYADSKNGKVFHKLYNLIIKENNIMLALNILKQSSGSMTRGTDGKNIKDYENMRPMQIVNIIRKRLERFQPMPIKRVFIPKNSGTLRNLGILTFEDRLIQQCFKQILEPICEAKFHPHSYGYRPLRSAKHALAQVMTLAQEYHYCVDIDIKDFFDTVDHEILMSQIYKMGICDKRVLAIIAKMLKSDIQGEGIQQAGISQGAILSPLFGNIVLNELDWWTISKCKASTANLSNSHLSKSMNISEKVHIIRYADDFKIMCKSYIDAFKMFCSAKCWLHETLKLNISDRKSKIVNLEVQTSDFLGFAIGLKKDGIRYTPFSNVSNDNKDKIMALFVDMILQRNHGKIRESEFVDKWNKQMTGLHHYYNAATMVRSDFEELKMSLSAATKDIIKSNPTDKCYERIIPIDDVSYRKPLPFSQYSNIYTQSGRKAISKIKSHSVKPKFKLKSRVNNTSSFNIIHKTYEFIKKILGFNNGSRPIYSVNEK